MKNWFIRLIACVLVCVMAFSIVACQNNGDANNDGGDNNTGDTGNSDNNTGDDNPGSWDDIWGDIDDSGDIGDDGDDTTGDDPVDEWDPWDEVKYFTVPNTSATINVVDVDTKAGFAADNGYTEANYTDFTEDNQ